MTEAAKNKVFFFRRRAENERDEELRALREGLIRTRTLINQAYVGFNGTGDPDLIESYVFRHDTPTCCGGSRSSRDRRPERWKAF